MMMTHKIREEMEEEVVNLIAKVISDESTDTEKWGQKEREDRQLLKQFSYMCHMI